MASLGSFLRSNSNSRTTLLSDDLGGGAAVRSTAELASFQDDMVNLSLSKRLAKNVSQKLKKKKKKCSESYHDLEIDAGAVSFSGCLGFDGKAGGCRVGACEETDINCSSILSSAEICKSGKSVVENAISMQGKFWRRGSRKEKGTEQCPSNSSPSISLPDDVLEMILVRLPWMSLIAARGVCRGWRCIIDSTHFMQRRTETSYQSTCLFLLGITLNGFNGGEIHALDISLDQWHRSSRVELKDRFLFSVASIRTDIYFVGGCSSLTDSKKTHREVLVFSPLKGSFHDAAPMTEARSAPIVGVFEGGFSSSIFQRKIQWHDRMQPKARADGNLDVYEDPHGFSLRPQLRDSLKVEDTKNLLPLTRKTSVYLKGNNQYSVALIAVGGHGSWDEPLYSGEIYDPVTNIWVEIARLPSSFGPVCCGTICNGVFYVYSEADKLAGYDLEKGNWMIIQVPFPSLRLQEYNPKLVSCGTRLFMLCVSWCERNGLLRREKAVRKMWELDLTSHLWSEVCRHPDAPMDWNASFVADQSKIYGVEMFRIFGQVLDFITACNVFDPETKWHRISRKHAAHEADASSCTTKSLLLVNL